MKITLSVTALLVLIALTGCAPPPPPTIQFQKTESNVHSIAILTPAMPAKPIVFALSGTGAIPVFGIIGAAIDANIQDARQDKYLAVLNASGFSLTSSLVDAVADELRRRGYTVSNGVVTRAKDEFLAKYPVESPPGADAELDLVITNYGYFSGPITDPYYPMVTILYRLARASDGKILMQGSFGYGPYNKAFVKPDAAYEFHDFDAIMADSKKSIMGISTGVNFAAKAIGGALE